MLLLLSAVVISALLGESSDSLIIFMILMITGMLGFWQEHKAGKAMDKLRNLIAAKHAVMRKGQELQLGSEDLLPDDILMLDAGDMIPADCVILESNELHVDESSLTGESFPVEKTPPDMTVQEASSNGQHTLWQGTSVISGTATAKVILTGKDTRYGKITGALETTTETSYEKGMRKFGLFLLRITLLLSVVILVSNLYFGKSLFSSLLFSLALAVGMAPELLPAVMTFSMSAGASRMLRKKVIVKRLASMFNLGEVNLLCTDKTGTLTQGISKVYDIVDTEGKGNELLYRYAFLNASLQKGFTNPLDHAIASLDLSIEGWKKVNEVPYDFIRKRLSVSVEKDGQKLLIMKGAFPNVLETCRFEGKDTEQPIVMDEPMRMALHDQFRRYGQQGYRVLGLAVKTLTDGRICRDDEKEMVFLGFILMEDPLKESTVSSLVNLESMGVTVKIITGDNRHAAAHIAEKIGLMGTGILTGEDMRKMSPQALVAKVRSTDIFAEIEPQQKELLVKAMQKSGYTVAYLGDGINDVAAIHAADTGISTNNAVDVAKDAADFVLLDKDLSVLSDGIEEGRRSFANSMKYIFITTGATFGNMFSIAGASLYLPFLPMLPKQILLNNLVSDLPFLTISTDHVEKEQLQKPGQWDLDQIRRFMVVFGIHSSVFDIITFFMLYRVFSLSESEFQTGWFIESTLTELMILLVIRTRKPFLKSNPGKWLWISVTSAFIVTILLPMTPLSEALGFSNLPPGLAASLTGILVVYMITADLLKLYFFRIQDKKRETTGRNK
jgi:Mg2+-importing ATPase